MDSGDHLNRKSEAQCQLETHRATFLHKVTLESSTELGQLRVRIVAGMPRNRLRLVRMLVVSMELEPRRLTITEVRNWRLHWYWLV